MHEYEVIARIQELCLARSWTFYRLAKESGIPYSTLCTMLHKANAPSIPTLIKICNGFGISLSQFFDTGSDAARLTEVEKAHLSLWAKLTPENRTAAARYVEYLLSTQASDA